MTLSIAERTQLRYQLAQQVNQLMIEIEPDLGEMVDGKWVIYLTRIQLVGDPLRGKIVLFRTGDSLRPQSIEGVYDLDKRSLAILTKLEIPYQVVT